MSTVDVAVGLPLKHPLSYRIPDHVDTIPEGTRVLVPVGKRTVDGIVVPSQSPPSKELQSKLKPVTGVVSSCHLTPQLFSFYKWVADYYVYPLGCVIHESVPQTWSLPPKSQRKKPATDAPLQAPAVSLSDEQSQAVDAINKKVSSGGYETFLLDGVTGSGKTEVYFNVLQETLRRGKSALLLVPEIALTPQLLDRYARFFGQRGFVYHSGLTPAQRHQTLWDLYSCAQESRPFVLIGTRSAVLLPADFSLIIVDEEHDGSYKQNDHLRYNARDIAVARGHQFKFPVVLGSATPSLESLHNVDVENYSYLKLSRRATGADLPEMEIVDLRQEQTRGSLLSSRMLELIQQNLDKNEQTVLFLNRRGFAPTLLCHDCGYIFKCKLCDIALTLSKESNTLRCHYCGSQHRVPLHCPECTQISLEALGSGTERIEEELLALFPKARIARFDRDTMSTPKKIRTLLGRLGAGDIDILVGTQMVAKGHDYPNVTLVGILLADSYLHFPEFRSSEKTFQLLTQVSGRAGRAEKPGRVIIQTYQPEHPALRAVYYTDRSIWRTPDAQTRKLHGYPPFHRMALIHLESRDSAVLQTAGHALKSALPESAVISALGPIPSPMPRLKGVHRAQMILKSPTARALQMMLRNYVLPRLEKIKQIDYYIDIDPQFLM